MCLSIISVPAVLSQSQSTGTFQDYNTYYSAIRAFGEPYEGSDAERSIQEFVAAKAVSLGFTVQRYNVQSQGKYHSFSRSVRITVPGKSSRVIGLQIPVSAPQATTKTHYDPWIGPAFATALLTNFSELERPYSIQIDLLGAESDPEPGLGTQRALEDPATLDRLFVLYLSLYSNARTWGLSGGTSGVISPLWLVDSALTGLEKNGIRFETSQVETQLHRIGLGPANRTGAYLKAGIPTIELRPSDADGPDLEQADFDKINAWVLDLTVRAPPPALAGPDDPPWDANYLVFSSGGTHSFVPESVLVIGLLTGMSVTLLIMALRRRAFIYYVVLLGRRLPAFLLLTAVSFAIFVLTSASIRLVTVSDLSAFLRPEAALVIVAIKLALGAFLFHSSFQVLRKILPKESTFYSAAAMAWSLIALIAVMSINMTLGIYSALALWGIGLGVMSRSPFLKMLFGTLGLAAMLWPLEEALRLYPSLQLLETLTISYIPGDLLIGVLSLPFALSLRRIIIMIPNRYKPKNKLNWLLIGTLVFFALATIVVLSFVFEEKKTDSPAITMSIQGNPDNNDAVLLLNGADLRRLRGLVLTSSMQKPETGVQDQNAGPQNQNKETAVTFDALPSGPVTKQVTLADKSVHLLYSTRTFLGRKSLVVTISSASALDSVDVSFDADTTLLVHSINFPYKYLEADTIQVLIGKHPPVPLRIEMTLPAETRGKLSVSSHSTQTATMRLDDNSKRDIEIPYSMNTSFQWN